MVGTRERERRGRRGTYVDLVDRAETSADVQSKKKDRKLPV